MSRARIVVLALGLAVAAAWALAGTWRSARPAAPSAPSHDVIDDASREELERLLRESGDGS